MHVFESSAVITRHGVFTYECLSLNKKTFILSDKEEDERLKDIKFLSKKKYVKLFDRNTFKKDLKGFYFKKIDFKFVCPVLIKKINNLL